MKRKLEENMVEMFNENILLEGVDGKDVQSVIQMLDKAVFRYKRYMRNMTFGKISYIKCFMLHFIQMENSFKSTEEQLNEAVKEMISIDTIMYGTIKGKRRRIC